ncbi:class F sortase [Jiangella ureilytica]|uniref:Class F sortase n=1 Tax=Jiangella ureilytica TaxID=2530374 RepID=A0A4R4RTT4_9ACTN|nr:class F sortase [Jiangella ureilytica]
MSGRLPARRTRGDRRLGRPAVTTALALLAATGLLTAGCGGDDQPIAGSTTPAAEPSPSTPAGATSPTPAPAPTPTAAPASAPELADPVAVAVPAVGIDTNIVPIAVDADNVLVPPPYGDAGWWQEGPEPGELGAAVIAGHLDSRDGPDVFYRLAEIAPGDEIVVTRADGGSSAFRVVDVGQYSQDDFPTEAVYGGPDDRPLLRLITCGGEYDRGLGRYRDNVVVFAEPA